MEIILNPGESLTAVMSGAAATTNPTYLATWVDGGNTNQPAGSLSGATAVTLVGSGLQAPRRVTHVAIHNADTAAVTVTLSKVSAGTTYNVLTRTLAVGDLLQVNADGAEVFASSATPAGVGAAAGTGVVASEQGDGVRHQTVLRLTDAPLTVTDALAYASQKIYDFPAGRILIEGVTSSLQFGVTSTRASTINDSAAMDWSVGSAAASSTTLATTMVDLVPKQDKTLDGVADAYTTAQGAALAASAQFDGTSTALDAYLNVAFPTTTDIDADGTLKISGTITISWVQLGDY